MVVIVIIGILLMIILPNMVRSKYQAQWTACSEQEHNLAIALESYSTQWGTYPTSLSVLTSTTGAAYIGTIPSCPSNGQSYISGYQVASSTGSTTSFDTYTVSCPGSHYLVLGDVSQGFPQYTPSKGLMQFDLTH